MGFSDGNFKPRTFANIKFNKQEGKIYFLINHKDKEPEQKQQFDGQLKEVKIKNWEYEGKPKESIQFIFDDGDSETWIESGWSNVSKGILNTLDGADSIGNVSIRLYINKKGYSSAYVEVNGQESNWKYKIEEMPKVQKVKVRGEEITDDLEQIKFFRDVVIPEINSKIAAPKVVQNEMKKYPQANGNTNTVDEADVMEDTTKSKAFTGSHTEIDSDLPF